VLTARRLYLYAMSGIALGVMVTGLSTLVEVILRQLGFGGGSLAFGAGTAARGQLSIATALLSVGVPVWAIHWWMVQRTASPGNPAAAAERASPVRALYVALVLAVSLLVGVASAVEAIRLALQDLAGLTDEMYRPDPTGSLALAVVLGTVWIYHWLVRDSDARAGPIAGPAAWLPRIYIYGISLVGLWAFLDSISGLVTSAFQLAAPEGDASAYMGDRGWLRDAAIRSGISIIAWGLVWGGHWRSANRTVVDHDWRGAQERPAETRLWAFAGTILLASALAVNGAAGACGAVIAWAINVPLGDLGLPAGSLAVAQRVAVPALAAVAWGVAWRAHVRWLQREPAALADPARALEQERRVSHATAAVGLAFAAMALGWLIGLVVDVTLGGNRTLDDGGYWKLELSRWLPMAAIGSAVWLWQWSRVLARRRHDPDAEAAATTRRAFLFLTIGVATVVAIVSAAIIIYRLAGTVLGADLTGNAVSELSTPIGALLVAVAVLLYHGVALRRDMALRSAAEVWPAELGATGPQPALPVRSVVHPGLRVRSIVIECRDRAAMTAFWAAALGYVEWSGEAGGASPGLRSPGPGAGPAIVFHQVPDPRPGTGRVYLDLGAPDQPSEVTRLVALGAKVVREIEHDGRAMTVMADPEGNEFRVVQGGLQGDAI